MTLTPVNMDTSQGIQARILIVDDNTDLLDALTEFLEPQGFAVTSACSSDHAREQEISGSLILSNVAENVEVLHEIRASGTRISIGDFCTGNSSLGYPMHLPIDAIKIDRTFVEEACAEDGDGTVVRAIVSLAESLEPEVVAYGIEQGPQLEYLAALGRQFAQVYYFSEPVAPDRLAVYCNSTAQSVPLKVPATPPVGRNRGSEKMRPLPTATWLRPPVFPAGCTARPVDCRPAGKRPVRALIEAES